MPSRPPQLSPFPLPRRWPWLVLTAAVAACAFFAHLGLHEREHEAEHAEQQATLFAAELRDRVQQTRRFVAQLPPKQADTVVAPVIAAAAQDGKARIDELAKTVDDPRVASLQAQVASLMRIAAEPTPRPIKALRLAAAAHRLAATADAIAATQDARSKTMAREAVIGSGLVLLLALLLVATILQRSHRLAVRASQQHARDMLALAARDPLTGLPNRRGLGDDLDHAARQATAGCPVQVLVCDLDGFKQLNDARGHEAGDDELMRFGDRLVASVGDDATVYRLGGDEFCVVSRPGRDVEAAVHLAAEADGEAGGPSDPALRASVGCALMPSEAGSPRAAMRLADERMYAAKLAARRDPAVA